MKNGLNLWDTATVVSTKFTPQLAEVYENSVEKMALASIDRMAIDYIDMYWIHNPMDVERWTPGLIPLLQSGKVKRVGVSNHNIAAESDRGKKYNPVLSQLEALTNEMTTIGQKYGASCSQIGIAWAIAKGYTAHHRSHEGTSRHHSIPACVAHLPGLRSTILLIALHSPTAHQCADARKG